MDQFVTPVPTTPSTPPAAQPRKDVANIYFILDKSGSMSVMQQQAIAGYNKYMADQRAHGGVTRATLVQFNDRRHVIYESRNVNELSELDSSTYAPSGYTALNDAVGFVLAENLATASPDETHIVAILTDGEENSSREYTLEQVKSMLAQAQERGWEVLFLGANMKAETVVSTYGIDHSNVAAFAATQKGVQDAFNTMSASSTSYRTMKSVGNIAGRVNVQAVYNATANNVPVDTVVKGSKT